MKYICVSEFSTPNSMMSYLYDYNENGRILHHTLHCIDNSTFRNTFYHWHVVTLIQIFPPQTLLQSRKLCMCKSLPTQGYKKMGLIRLRITLVILIVQRQNSKVFIDRSVFSSKQIVKCHKLISRFYKLQLFFFWNCISSAFLTKIDSQFVNLKEVFRNT